MKRLFNLFALPIFASVLFSTSVFANGDNFSDNVVSENISAEALNELRADMVSVELANGTFTEASVFAKTFAFLDYDSSSDEIRQLIIEARYEIIFNNSWCLTGESFVTDRTTGEIVEISPKFYDLFPYDWSLPGAGSYDYDSYDYENNYIIDFYDLNIVDVFNYYQYMELLALEDPNLFEAFMEARINMEMQSGAIEAYSLIVDSFIHYVDGYIDFIYPSYYAGAFIDGDTLVIQLTNLSPSVTQFYTDIVGTYAPIRFEEVQFDFNTLMSFGQIFVDNIDANVVSFGIDTIGNTFNISLYENDADSIDARSSFSDMARFVGIPISVSLDTFPEAELLIGGSGIRTSTSNFSVGLTGTRNNSNQAALLTTGHAFLNVPVGTRVYRGNQHIGDLQVSRFGNTFSTGSPGTVGGDWAVINLNSVGASMMTNETRLGDRINAWSSQHTPVGTLFMGAGVNNFWHGRVSQINQTLTFTDVGPSNLSTNVSGITIARRYAGNSQDGDSGGTIFTTPNAHTVTMIGIHVGVRGNAETLFSPMLWNNHQFTPRTVN